MISLRVDETDQIIAYRAFLAPGRKKLHETQGEIDPALKTLADMKFFISSCTAIKDDKTKIINFGIAYFIVSYKSE